MSNDYIRREDVIDKINERQRKLIYCFGFDNDIVKIMDIAKSIVIAIPSAQPELEPADVAPVVHAYWIPQKENHEFKEAWMKCSACGYPVSMWTGNTNFCPNCGAKMDVRV